MKIDTAIKEFVEHVDRKALYSIDELSKERGLQLHKKTVPSFTLKESCDEFAKYLIGYSMYKVNNKDNTEASPHEAVMEASQHAIEGYFKPKDILYQDLPSFVESYISGIQTVLESVNDAKKRMFEGEVDNASIAGINEMADNFMDRLNEKFKPWMERVLWESGYMSDKRLAKDAKPVKKENTAPIFL